MNKKANLLEGSRNEPLKGKHSTVQESWKDSAGWNGQDGGEEDTRRVRRGDR